MEKALLVIVLLLVACCAVLLAAVLVKLSKSKNENNDSSLNELAQKTANGFASAGAASKAQAEMLGQRISELTAFNTEQQTNLIKSVADIRSDLSESARRQTVELKNAVNEMQRTNAEKLEQMRATVDEKLSATLTERIDSSFKTVSEQLGNVYSSLGEMKELSNGISSLNKMFSGIKLRGTWAEAQLDGILERIIPGMYIKNFKPQNGSGIVEFAVTVPDTDGGITYLPLDSKFPTEDYLRLSEAAEAGDAEGVKAARAALGKKVLSEAKEVAKYISPPETTPFAVMYLATDALYAEVVSLPENIPDRLHDEFSVMLAGPSTITALLSSLAMGFKTVALNKKASDVMNVLAAAKKQYDTFALSLEKVGRKMDEAGSALDDAIKRNNIIVKKLKSVEEIDAASADGILSDG